VRDSSRLENLYLGAGSSTLTSSEPVVATASDSG
jgi:hypothetical protein